LQNDSYFANGAGEFLQFAKNSWNQDLTTLEELSNLNRGQDLTTFEKLSNLNRVKI